MKRIYLLGRTLPSSSLAGHPQKGPSTSLDVVGEACEWPPLKIPNAYSSRHALVVS